MDEPLVMDQQTDGSSDAMLALNGITRRYGRDTVLDDVSFEVPRGETLVLFGPSGAGKTVLLRLIAGVVEPDGGTVFIDGRDVHGVEPEARGIGMAFQNFALFPHLSAHENIATPLHALGDDAADRAARVSRVARLLKIDHVLKQNPGALSNGQKQRTSLARALVAEPALLLLDDPLRNVDAKLRFEMRLELPRLLADQGTTVVYVTQDYKEAMALGDRIAVLVDGRIEQIGTPADIYLEPATRQIATLFGDPAINLLDVEPVASEHGPAVELSGKRFLLDPGYAHAIGRSCVLGIRPESIRLVDQGGEPGGFPDPGTVSSAEQRGDPGVDPRADPRVDPRVDPGSDPGVDPGVDLGVDLGADPGADSAAVPGADPGAEEGFIGVSGDPIPVTVEAETPLNEKVVDLVTTLRGREILVSRPAHMPGPVGSSTHIVIPTSQALLFDRESGRRIPLEGEPPR